MAGAIATSPAESICGVFEPYSSSGTPPYTGIDVWPVPIVSAVDHTQVAGGTGRVELRLIEIVREGSVLIGHRSVGEADGSPIAIPLNDTAYFPLNGSERFTIEVSTDTVYPGTSTALDIRWRPVTR
jgi:hypothetical protein